MMHGCIIAEWLGGYQEEMVPTHPHQGHAVPLIISRHGVGMSEGLVDAEP